MTIVFHSADQISDLVYSVHRLPFSMGYSSPAPSRPDTSTGGALHKYPEVRIQLPLRSIHSQLQVMLIIAMTTSNLLLHPAVQARVS